jgi:hypothetical protein
MATIIKIVLGLALLTAVAQAGMAAFTNYQFEDALHEALLFAPNSSEADIHRMVKDVADAHELTVSADDITIREQGAELRVAVTYETEVNLLPGLYARTWTFNPSTSIRVMPGTRNKRR